MCKYKLACGDGDYEDDRICESYILQKTLDKNISQAEIDEIMSDKNYSKKNFISKELICITDEKIIDDFIKNMERIDDFDDMYKYNKGKIHLIIYEPSKFLKKEIWNYSRKKINYLYELFAQSDYLYFYD